MPSPDSLQTTSWSSIGEDIIKKYENREADAKKRKCYRKYQYSDLPSYKEIVNSGINRFKNFEAAMRFYFEHASLRLGYMQKKLMDALVVSVLKKIFQEDLITNLKFLSNKFAIDELNDAVAFLFPSGTTFLEIIKSFVYSSFYMLSLLFWSFVIICLSFTFLVFGGVAFSVFNAYIFKTIV